MNDIVANLTATNLKNDHYVISLKNLKVYLL